MANSNYSLAHTKWMCKYHIVFTPKYRRKIIYNQLKADIREILRSLCKYKGMEIIEYILDFQFFGEKKIIVISIKNIWKWQKVCS